MEQQRPRSESVMVEKVGCGVGRTVGWQKIKTASVLT
jgi:hypothetical protein